MFISIFILILILPAAFMPLALDTFSPNELSEMGICLGNSEFTDPLPNTKTCNSENACQLWNITKQVTA